MKTIHRPLLNWLKTATDEQISKTGTTRAYARLIAYGQKRPSAAMAIGIERATEGTVTRQALRPCDWFSLWPELAATLNRTIPTSPPHVESDEHAGDLSSAQQGLIVTSRQSQVLLSG